MDAIKTIKGQDYKEIVKLFKRHVAVEIQTKALKEYDVEKHDVFDAALRPFRKVSRATTAVDANGDFVMQDVWIDVVRVGIAWQKVITERRVGFTLSTPVEINITWDKETDKEKKLVDLVYRILDDNKMDYKNKEILRRKLSEMEVAVIWYYIESEDLDMKYTLKSKIVSPSLGDMLYPLFDVNGKMIAFRRDYVLLEDDKKVEHSDIYTAEYNYTYVKRSGEWLAEPKPVPNIAKKILVEYYSQPRPVWYNVQSLINRHETLTSNHGGMNDKFGAPMFIVSGEIKGEIIDNQTGSVMQMENQGAAAYAQLSSEPESISLEQKNLEKFIYTMSQTPNITFDQMIQIGQMSGFAAEMLFSDPHMAVRTEEETFGIGLQRRLNIIKAAIGALIDTSLVKECKIIQLKPIITPYLPQNVTEMIENLSVSKTSGLMSTMTAVEKNPLIEDADVEMKRLKEDATTELAGTENII